MKRARHRRAAMCDHVDFAKARRRSLPIVEGADRNFAPDCRVEARAAPFAPTRHELYIAEEAVDGCGTDGENTITIRLAELQSSVLLKCRQQSRDHYLEPLAAYPIRRLPQRRQHILGRRAVSATALSRRHELARRDSLALPKCAHRVLAMPTCCRA